MAYQDRFVYFVIFDGTPEGERRAKKFAMNLPSGCLLDKVHGPGDDLPPGPEDPWWVTLRGLWTNPEDGDEVLEPLAVQHGGKYDGWDESGAYDTLLVSHPSR